MLAWMQEHGPYVMDDGGSLPFNENQYSWNKQANMLYIESPAGIGFSYCDNTQAPEDCASDDYSSAVDNLEVLKQWFVRFPDYKASKLYISGESYAGIYVPYLLREIDTYNSDESTSEADKINLIGVLVGNGVTNWAYDTMPATIDMGYWRSIISQEALDEVTRLNCNYSLIDFGKNASDTCMDLLDTVDDTIEFINIYNIYGTCYGGDPSSENKGFTAKDYTPWLFRSNKHKISDDLIRSSSKKIKSANELPPCTFGQPLIDFMNDPKTKTALHIPENVQDWTMCKDDYNYTMFDNATYSIWADKDITSKYRMLKYSGDKDGCVPTIGTLGWINSLELDVKKDWRAWYLEDSDTLAGYVQEFDGITFVSVHGAGHMVPQDQREAGLLMLNSWITEQELPTKKDPPSTAEVEIVQ